MIIDSGLELSTCHLYCSPHGRPNRAKTRRSDVLQTLRKIFFLNCYFQVEKEAMKLKSKHYSVTSDIRNHTESEPTTQNTNVIQFFHVRLLILNTWKSQDLTFIVIITPETITHF